MGIRYIKNPKKNTEHYTSCLAFNQQKIDWNLIFEYEELHEWDE